MRIIPIQKIPATEKDVVEPIKQESLLGAIGHAQFYDLLYRRLNARAYPSHAESDFGLQMRSDGIATYVELMSNITGKLLEWCIWDEEENL